MLPRRYSATVASEVTDDIIRDRDRFKTKVIDNNDVAGAQVVKENILKIEALENRVLTLETSGASTVNIGSIVEFDTAFISNK